MCIWPISTVAHEPPLINGLAIHERIRVEYLEDSVLKNHTKMVSAKDDIRVSNLPCNLSLFVSDSELEILIAYKVRYAS